MGKAAKPLPTEEEEFTPRDQQEDETDLFGEETGDLNQSVLFNTDWTVGTILDQIKKGNISLDPQFQRRNAWDIGRKSRLIESLMLGLPVPNIVLAEVKGHKGKFIVIDGKQRLLSIFEFYDEKDPLLLSELTLRKNLEGKTKEDIEADPALAPALTELDNQSIRTIVIRNWPSEKFLYVIFYRLNSGSLPLSPQELRKALHPGEFLDYLEEYLEGGGGVTKVLPQGALDRRMRDTELALRYVAFELFYPDRYGSSFKTFLDDTVKYFNSDWKKRKVELDKALEKQDGAVDAALDVFGPRDVFRKWNGTTFEKRINRAVFDVICRYFDNDATIKAVKAKKKEVVEGFKALCQDNDEFRRSIEQTTKTPLATETRMRLWGEALAKIIGKKFDKASVRLI